MGGPGSGRKKGYGGFKKDNWKMSKMRKKLLGKSRPPKHIRKAGKKLFKSTIWYPTTN